MIINSLLDTDLYKFTMQQAVFHRFPDTPVEYAFKCRTQSVLLNEIADELEAEIEAFCSLKLTAGELAYLESLDYFKPGYLDALSSMQLRSENVEIIRKPEFGIRIRGDWFHTILFEVPLLALVNELYFRRANPMTAEVSAEGMRRLEEKCALVKEKNLPDFKFIEFGTRRRYRRDWQEKVIAYLADNLQRSFLGTSNVAAARKFRLKCFGTMAHEFLQACQAFAPLPDFQRFAFETWMMEYRGKLGIALSDVVGMGAFMRDFDLLLSKAYDGARHDSGEPMLWGEKLIAHYEKMGIDPRTKQAIFTDGLDFPRALQLAEHFSGRIQTSFGIGTNLTNDLGFPALNIVMKMTRCCGRPVAKLSDAPGKTMCDDEVFLNYLRSIF